MRDKSQSGTDGQRGNVPGGSILPTECGFNFHSAAAGAREDIIPLINHFLMVENQKYHTNKSIYSDTIDAFEGYCWPGNVRELENLLENLVITTPGDIIRRENLPLKLRRPQQVSAEEEEETVSLKSVVERAEYAAIERAIEKYGSIRKAAAALDVNPSTITRKMQLYKDMSSRKQNK